MIKVQKSGLFKLSYANINLAFKSVAIVKEIIKGIVVKKVSLLVCGLFFATVGSAQEAQVQKKPSLNEIKTQLISAIDQRVDLLEQTKVCINEASSMEAVKECRNLKPKKKPKK